MSLIQAHNHCAPLIRRTHAWNATW